MSVCASGSPVTGDSLDRLEATVRARRDAGDDPASYTASLFARGRSRIAQKLGEEAIETVIAACGDDPRAIVPEAADLLFHLVVLLVDAGLGLDDVRAELARREGVSGLAEKVGRQAPLPLAGGVGGGPDEDKALRLKVVPPPAPPASGRGVRCP